MRVLSQAKRQDILDKASQVFAEVGYERTSMAEISARVGGSKATLYRYFPSKMDLFLEVAEASARKHLGDVPEKARNQQDVAQRLQDLGQVLMPFLLSQDMVARERMVISEAGQSDIGQLYYHAGPGKGLAVLTDFFADAVTMKWLRPEDPHVIACHAIALLQSEISPPRLFGVPINDSPAYLNAAVARAVDVFMRAYATPETRDR